MLGGHYEPLLSKLAEMPPAASEAQQEYWQEELERVKKYAAKAKRIREGAALKLLWLRQDDSPPRLCLGYEKSL
jgi:hypothetical protein